MALADERREREADLVDPLGSMQGNAIGLGWRVHSWRALVVAVRGPAMSPEIVHREEIILIDDEATREPYHAACAVPIDEAPALIGSVEKAAAAAAMKAITGFISSLGCVAAVGVVGGNRKVPSQLSRRLASHAMLHAAERDLYERAIIEGATTAKLPVTTIPATGKLFGDASDVLGVKIEPTLASLGKSVGRPWQKDHKEATAAALVALKAVVGLTDVGAQRGSERSLPGRVAKRPASTGTVAW